MASRRASLGTVSGRRGIGVTRRQSSVQSNYFTRNPSLLKRIPLLRQSIESQKAETEELQEQVQSVVNDINSGKINSYSQIPSNIAKYLNIDESYFKQKAETDKKNKIISAYNSWVKNASKVQSKYGFTPTTIPDILKGTDYEKKIKNIIEVGQRAELANYYAQKYASGEIKEIPKQYSKYISVETIPDISGEKIKVTTAYGDTYTNIKPYSTDKLGQGMSIAPELANKNKYYLDPYTLERKEIPSSPSDYSNVDEFKLKNVQYKTGKTTDLKTTKDIKFNESAKGITGNIVSASSFDSNISDIGMDTDGTSRLSSGDNGGFINTILSNLGSVTDFSNYKEVGKEEIYSSDLGGFVSASPTGEQGTAYLREPTKEEKKAIESAQETGDLPKEIISEKIIEPISSFPIESTKTVINTANILDEQIQSKYNIDVKEVIPKVIDYSLAPIEKAKKFGKENILEPVMQNIDETINSFSLIKDIKKSDIKDIKTDNKGIKNIQSAIEFTDALDEGLSNKYDIDVKNIKKVTGTLLTDIGKSQISNLSRPAELLESGFNAWGNALDKGYANRIELANTIKNLDDSTAKNRLLKMIFWQPNWVIDVEYNLLKGGLTVGKFGVYALPYIGEALLVSELAQSGKTYVNANKSADNMLRAGAKDAWNENSKELQEQGYSQDSFTQEYINTYKSDLVNELKTNALLDASLNLSFLAVSAGAKGYKAIKNKINTRKIYTAKSDVMADLKLGRELEKYRNIPNTKIGTSSGIVTSGFDKLNNILKNTVGVSDDILKNIDEVKWSVSTQEVVQNIRKARTANLDDILKGKSADILGTEKLSKLFKTYYAGVGKGGKEIVYIVDTVPKTSFRNAITLTIKTDKGVVSRSFAFISNKNLSKFRDLSTILKYAKNKNFIVSTAEAGSNLIESGVYKYRNGKLTKTADYVSKVEKTSSKIDDITGRLDETYKVDIKRKLDTDLPISLEKQFDLQPTFTESAIKVSKGKPQKIIQKVDDLTEFTSDTVKLQKVLDTGLSAQAEKSFFFTNQLEPIKQSKIVKGASKKYSELAEALYRDSSLKQVSLTGDSIFSGIDDLGKDIYKSKKELKKIAQLKQIERTKSILSNTDDILKSTSKSSDDAVKTLSKSTDDISGKLKTEIISQDIQKTASESIALSLTPTRAGTRINNVDIIKSIANTDISLAKAIGSGIIGATKQAVSQSQKQQSKQALEQLDKSKLGLLNSTEFIQSESQLPAQLQDVATKQASTLKTSLKKDTTDILVPQIPINIPDRTYTPDIKPPKEPTLLINLNLKKRKLPQEPIKKELGYDVYIKKPKTNQYIKVTKKPTYLNDAKNLRALLLDNTSSRTGTIKPTNRQANPLGFNVPNDYARRTQDKFRTFKQRKGVKSSLQNTIIEKNKFINDTYGEKKSLSVFKKMAQIERKRIPSKSNQPIGLQIR